MTTPKRGKRGESLSARLRRDIEKADTVVQWPSPRWRDDPIGFFREVLLVELLSDDQERVIRAAKKRRWRGSVTSGHKTGKDYLAAGLALWFFCSFPGARVRVTAVKLEQVRDIFWRELVEHWRRSQQGPFPIDGKPATLPQNGLRSGLREVIGFTAEQAEGAAGISGAHVFYIFDEASGIEDKIFEVTTGNLAGGDARVLMLSQPTRNRGHFYASHHDRAALWERFTLSSENTPNAREGREVIPGMASREWLAEQAIDWNAPDGPIWKIRVKGEFATGGDLLVMHPELVIAAEARWASMPMPRERLHVGFDVAGQGLDENVAAPRRGAKILELVAWNSDGRLDAEETAKANAARLVQVVRQHRTDRDPKALVKVDASGSIGVQVFSALRSSQYEHEIDVVGVHFGTPSTMVREYALVRDEMWFGFSAWLAEGGAVPPDRKLPSELTAPSWSYDERQRRHVEKKELLRRRLNRSTDRADACILSVYEPRNMRVLDDDDDDQAGDVFAKRGEGIDPYGGTIDPYGGAISSYGSQW